MTVVGVLAGIPLPKVAVPRGARHAGARGGGPQGVAVQVDPIKPTLKTPGTMRLRLIYGELLSSFAFKFNLCRYSKGFRPQIDSYSAFCDNDHSTSTGLEATLQRLARAYTRSTLSST